MWIPNHVILITTQKIIHVGELLAIPFPAWASCLGHSKVQVQDCPINLPSYLTDAGPPFPIILFHVLLFPVYCTFQDLQVLLQTFEDDASLLERSAQDRDNRASSCFSTACPCHDPTLQAPTLAEQSTPACWSHTLTVRDPRLGDHHLLRQTEFPCGLAQVLIVPGQGH